MTGGFNDKNVKVIRATAGAEALTVTLTLEQCMMPPSNSWKGWRQNQRPWSFPLWWHGACCYPPPSGWAGGSGVGGGLGHVPRNGMEHNSVFHLLNEAAAAADTKVVPHVVAQRKVPPSIF